MTAYFYDALNRQDLVIEAFSTAVARSTRFGYDRADRLLWQQDAAGVVTSFAYDLLGQRTKQVEAHGTTLSRQTVYQPKPTQRQQVVEVGHNPAVSNERKTTYTYDALDRVTTVTRGTVHFDPLVSEVKYDGLGRVLWQKDERGTITSFGYDTLGRRTDVIEAFGTDEKRHTRYEYDGNDNVIKVMDARGTVTRTEYDWLDRATTVTEAFGETGLQRTRLMEYDRLDRVVAIKTPLQYDYDTAGQPLPSPTRVVTTFAYDALGRRTETTEAATDTSGLRRTTTVIYDVLDRVHALVNGMGERTTFTYDELGQRTEVQDALHRRTTAVYDAVGRVIVTVDALGKRTTNVYDVLGRRTSVRAPDGGITTYGYNLAGDLILEINPVGKRTTITYDFEGNKDVITDPLGQTTRYDYDQAGQVTKVTDASDYTTTYDYDALGRRVWAEDPAGNREWYEYAPDGAWTLVTDRDGRARRSVFDALGRKVSEQWFSSLVEGQPLPSPDHQFHFTFDAADRLTRAEQGSESIVFRYDALNRQTRSEDQFGVILNSQYDLADRRVRVEDSFGGVVTSLSDAAGQLTSRTLRYSGESLRVDLTYTARGETESVRRFSSAESTTAGSTTTFAYDSVGRTLSATHLVKPKIGFLATPFSTSAEFDLAGRVLVEDNNYRGAYSHVTHSYDTPPPADNPAHFDDAGRMIRHGYSGYEYDLSGNRVSSWETSSLTLALGETIDGWYARATRLLPITYTHDIAHRLVAAGQNGVLEVVSMRVEYDALGRRQRLSEEKWKRADLGLVAAVNRATRFSYDAAGLWADLKDDNTLSVRYLLGDRGERFARVRYDASGVKHAAWYLPDRVGNTQLLTDREGVAILTYQGGNPMLAKLEPLADRWRYAGAQTHSVLGLLFVGGQHEDTAVGRSVEADETALATGETNPRRNRGMNPGKSDDGGGWWSMLSWANGGASLGSFVGWLNGTTPRVSGPWALVSEAWDASKQGPTAGGAYAMSMFEAGASLGRDPLGYVDSGLFWGAFAAGAWQSGDKEGGYEEAGIRKT